MDALKRVVRVAGNRLIYFKRLNGCAAIGRIVGEVLQLRSRFSTSTGHYRPEAVATYVTKAQQRQMHPSRICSASFPKAIRRTGPAAILLQVRLVSILSCFGPSFSRQVR